MERQRLLGTGPGSSQRTDQHRERGHAKKADCLGAGRLAQSHGDRGGLGVTDLGKGFQKGEKKGGGREVKAGEEGKAGVYHCDFLGWTTHKEGQ